MQAFLRFLADYGRLVVWVALIAIVLVCLAGIAAYNRMAALLGGDAEPAHAGEHSAA